MRKANLSRSARAKMFYVDVRTSDTRYDVPCIAFGKIQIIAEYPSRYMRCLKCTLTLSLTIFDYHY